MIPSVSPKVFEQLVQSSGMQLARPKIFVSTKGNLPQQQNDRFDSLEVSTDGLAQPLGRTWLGTSVFTGLEFLSGSYRLRDGQLKSYNAFEESAVILNVSQQKNIVMTAMAGVDGTVKEYISKGDYAVMINMVLTNPESEERPTERLESLLEILDSNREIPVYSPFLTLFGIANLVIEGYQIDEMEGSLNTISVQITALSDNPISLRINR